MFTALPAAILTCWSQQIVDNIMSHPLEDKYRSIKKANKQFASRVGDVTGGNACMRGLGFNDSDPAHWVSWKKRNNCRYHARYSLSASMPETVPEMRVKWECVTSVA